MARIGGTAIYEKFFHKTLKDAQIYAIIAVKKMFECEIICSEHGLQCEGANLFNHGPGNYVCQLLEVIPAVIRDEDLSYMKHSKLIVKTGMYINVHSLPEQQCTSLKTFVI
jgi:hypothetical protein